MPATVRLPRFSGRSAVLLSACMLGAFAAPAQAQDTSPPSAVEIEVGVDVVTDYRFRGVSLSEGGLAVQPYVEVAHESGFYAGVWGSNIEGGDTFGDVEVDLYAGYSANLSSLVTLDVGVVYYAYPDGDGPADYYEPFVSLSGEFGPASASLTANYAPEQESLGDEDNLYIALDLEVGVPSTPLTVSGHVGYTDGVLAPPLLSGLTDDRGFDYSAGISYALPAGFTASVSYIATEGLDVEDFTDDAVVASLGWSTTF